jgi:hypothetical protein
MGHLTASREISAAKRIRYLETSNAVAVLTCKFPCGPGPPLILLNADDFKIKWGIL